MKYVKDLKNYKGKIFKLYMNRSSDGTCYLVALPEQIREKSTMVVESYNSGGRSKDTYKENVKAALLEGTSIDKLLIDAIENQPIVLPITPDVRHCSDCQQLSRESVLEEEMHLRFFDCIEAARKDIEKFTGKKLNDKIFLNGYSASGVFAQRFSFIYPELIDQCLIGGAAGTIPVPSKDLDYPIGIKDFEKLFDKPFNKEAFEQIQFGYYVAENEERENAEYDINGDKIIDPDQIPAPMHDMSYRAPTTPKEVGADQREALGETMNERFKYAIEYYKELGIDVSAIILRGADHGTIFNSNLNRSASYLHKQILNFYNNRTPLQYDSVNCVKNIEGKFQKTRNGITEETKEQKYISLQ